MANKRYTVWEGKESWVFADWKTVETLVKGFKWAKYKWFSSKIEAEQALWEGRERYYQPEKKRNEKELPFLKESIAVDAACSSASWIMEYQGIDLVSWSQVFHFSFPHGTNNIGEFLGIVHGLSYLKEKKSDYNLYSDSKIAINWVHEGKCKTNLPHTAETEKLFELIKRAEQWLSENSYETQILKRKTEEWWEIPADFGRK